MAKNSVIKNSSSKTDAASGADAAPVTDVARHDAKTNNSTNNGGDQNSKLAKIIAEQQAIKERIGRVPLLLPLIASFGLVSLFYGFEHLLDGTFLAQQPILMVAVGVILLLFTGTYQQKL